MDITDLYDRIAAGETPDDLSEQDARWMRKPLLERALERTQSSAVADRIGALRVAGFLGAERALVVTARLMRDPDRGIRVSAFNQAVAGRELGRPLLRDAIESGDAELMAAALDLLGRAGDQPTLKAARRHIRHDDPAVRTAAATAIGMVGGRSATVQLEPAPGDTAAVLAAKALSADWIRGDAARPPAAVWWSDAPVPFPSGDPDAEPVHRAPAAAAEPTPTEEAPKKAKKTKPSKSKAKSKSKGDDAPVTSTSLVPAAAEPEPPAAGAAAPSPSSAALPDPMPEEPRALLKLLGLAAVEHHDAVLEHIRALDAEDVARQWIAWSPGGDAALGRGIALAAGRLQRQAFLSKAQKMLRDTDPGVRAAAFEAVGHLAGASGLVPVRNGINDSDPDVRIAALHALAAIGARTDRQSMTRTWIEALANDAEPRVVETVNQLLAQA